MVPDGHALITYSNFFHFPEGCFHYMKDENIVRTWIFVFSSFIDCFTHLGILRREMRFESLYWYLTHEKI